MNLGCNPPQHLDVIPFCLAIPPKNGLAPKSLHALDDFCQGGEILFLTLLGDPVSEGEHFTVARIREQVYRAKTGQHAASASLVEGISFINGILVDPSVELASDD